jgi:hypothetical protein
VLLVQPPDCNVQSALFAHIDVQVLLADRATGWLPDDSVIVEDDQACETRGCLHDHLANHRLPRPLRRGVNPRVRESSNKSAQVVDDYTGCYLAIPVGAEGYEASCSPLLRDKNDRGCTWASRQIPNRDTAIAVSVTTHSRQSLAIL